MQTQQTPSFQQLYAQYANWISNQAPFNQYLQQTLGKLLQLATFQSLTLLMDYLVKIEYAQNAMLETLNVVKQRIQTKNFPILQNNLLVKKLDLLFMIQQTKNAYSNIQNETKSATVRLVELQTTKATQIQQLNARLKQLGLMNTQLITSQQTQTKKNEQQKNKLLAQIDMLGNTYNDKDQKWLIVKRQLQIQRAQYAKLRKAYKAVSQQKQFVQSKSWQDKQKLTQYQQQIKQLGFKISKNEQIQSKLNTERDGLQKKIYLLVNQLTVSNLKVQKQQFQHNKTLTKLSDHQHQMAKLNTKVDSLKRDNLKEQTRRYKQIDELNNKFAKQIDKKVKQAIQLGYQKQKLQIRLGEQQAETRRISALNERNESLNIDLTQRNASIQIMLKSLTDQVEIQKLKSKKLLLQNQQLSTQIQLNSDSSKVALQVLQKNQIQLKKQRLHIDEIQRQSFISTVQKLKEQIKLYQNLNIQLQNVNAKYASILQMYGQQQKKININRQFLQNKINKNKQQSNQNKKQLISKINGIQSQITQSIRQIRQMQQDGYQHTQRTDKQLRNIQKQLEISNNSFIKMKANASGYITFNNKQLIKIYNAIRQLKFDTKQSSLSFKQAIQKIDIKIKQILLENQYTGIQVAQNKQEIKRIKQNRQWQYQSTIPSLRYKLMQANNYRAFYN